MSLRCDPQAFIQAIYWIKTVIPDLQRPVQTAMTSRNKHSPLFPLMKDAKVTRSFWRNMKNHQPRSTSCTWPDLTFCSSCSSFSGSSPIPARSVRYMHEQRDCYFLIVIIRYYYFYRRYLTLLLFLSTPFDIFVFFIVIIQLYYYHHHRPHADGDHNEDHSELN